MCRPHEAKHTHTHMKARRRSRAGPGVARMCATRVLYLALALAQKRSGAPGPMTTRGVPGDPEGEARVVAPREKSTPTHTFAATSSGPKPEASQGDAGARAPGRQQGL